MSDASSGSGLSFTERARQFLAARFDPKSQLGLGLTISLGAFVLAIWALSGLLDAVLDNTTLVRVDMRAAAWFHAHSTPTGLKIFDVITQLGAPAVDVVIVLVGIYLWRAREHLLLWSWLAANLGSKVVEHVLKSTVHRSRPEYSASYLFTQSYSFPSGHSMGSTVCYLLLSYLIVMRVPMRSTARAAVYVLAIALILAVAFSRLYLGVHYPSDVVGGMAAGVAWLSVCGATRRVVAHRWSLST